MSNKVRAFIALTGGGAGALDAIDGDDLSDLDVAVVVTATDVYFYTLDDDFGDVAESSPTTIKPDTNYGTKMWVRKGINSHSYPVRSRFRWKDADEIYIGPGVYFHSGTTDQKVYWNSELTKAISSPAGPDIYYLYLDDSAIVSAGTNLLTATEFIFSTTEPTEDLTKKGWYNGNDRCIFAVYVNASNAISEFHHEGNLFYLNASYSVYNAADVDTTYVNVDCTTYQPVFSSTAMVSFILDALTTDGEVYVMARADGSGFTNGIRCVGIERIGTDQTIHSGVLPIPTLSGVLEMRCSRSDADKIECLWQGYQLPDTI